MKVCAVTPLNTYKDKYNVNNKINNYSSNVSCMQSNISFTGISQWDRFPKLLKKIKICLPLKLDSDMILEHLTRKGFNKTLENVNHKLEKFPDIKDKLKDTNYNQYNIQVLDRILNNKNVMSSKYFMSSLKDILVHTTLHPQAKAMVRIMRNEDMYANQGIIEGIDPILACIDNESELKLIDRLEYYTGKVLKSRKDELSNKSNYSFVIDILDSKDSDWNSFVKLTKSKAEVLNRLSLNTLYNIIQSHPDEIDEIIKKSEALSLLQKSHLKLFDESGIKSIFFEVPGLMSDDIKKLITEFSMINPTLLDGFPQVVKNVVLLKTYIEKTNSADLSNLIANLSLIKKKFTPQQIKFLGEDYWGIMVTENIKPKDYSKILDQSKYFLENADKNTVENFKDNFLKMLLRFPLNKPIEQIIEKLNILTDFTNKSSAYVTNDIVKKVLYSDISTKQLKSNIKFAYKKHGILEDQKKLCRILLTRQVDLNKNSDLLKNVFNNDEQNKYALEIINYLKSKYSNVNPEFLFFIKNLFKSQNDIEFVNRKDFSLEFFKHNIENLYNIYVNVCKNPELYLSNKFSDKVINAEKKLWALDILKKLNGDEYNKKLTKFRKDKKLPDDKIPQENEILSDLTKEEKLSLETLKGLKEILQANTPEEIYKCNIKYKDVIEKIFEIKAELNEFFSENYTDMLKAVSNSDSETIMQLLSKHTQNFKDVVQTISEMDALNGEVLANIVRNGKGIDSKGNIRKLTGKEKIWLAKFIKRKSTLADNGYPNIDLNKYMKPLDRDGFLVDFKGLKQTFISPMLKLHGLNDNEISNLSQEIMDRWSNVDIQYLMKESESLDDIIQATSIGKFRKLLFSHKNKLGFDNIYGNVNRNTYYEFMANGLNHKRWLEGIPEKEIYFNGKKYTMELTKKDPQKEITMWNDVNACTGFGECQASADKYILTNAIQALLIRDKEGNIVCASRMYMGKVNGKPALMVENIEINSTFQRELSDKQEFTLTNNIFEYEKEFAKALRAKGSQEEIPVYFSTSYGKLHISSHDEFKNSMPKKNLDVEFIGDAYTPMYLNSAKKSVNIQEEMKNGNKLKAEFYIVKD